MTGSEPAAVERRALALIERLVDHPGDLRFRQRLLKREAAEVVARVARLQGVSGLEHRLPTNLPDAADPKDAEPPERFGPFRITKLIGRGGMGEVWQGERDDGLYDQIVAVKLVQAHLPVKAGLAFANERRMLARLEHPNISRLIDGGTTADGRACFVMEFVDGVPLDEACAGRPLRARLDLFLQAARAVGYAHGKLIAHGDLKPSNILVDRDGRVRLLDFGIARLITDEQNGFALTGVVTSGFASPARLRGEPPTVFDDVFALGKILQIILGADGNSDLAAIVGKAMAESEVNRYGGTADLIADLQRLEDGRPVGAVRRTGAYVARKYVRRRWKSLATLSLMAVAVATATWSYVHAENSRRLAQARFDEIHRLSNYMLFDLYDVLARLPGTTRVRADIALKSHAYLTKLASTPDAPPRLRLDIAKGYLRIAEVQGLSGNANLGRSRATIASIVQAQTLLVPLFRAYSSDADVRVAMAAAMTMRSRSLLYIDHDPARALLVARLAERALLVTGISPTDPVERRALRAARMAEGDALTWLDRPNEALTILQGELDDEPGRSDRAPVAIEDRRLTVRNLRFIGEAAIYAHDLPRAIDGLRQGAAKADAIVRAANHRPADVISFINVAQALGEAEQEAGRAPEALAALAAAEQAAARLVAFDPADLESRKRALSVGGDLVEALIDNRRLADAALLMDQVRKGYLALLRTDAGNAALFRAYARSIKPAGDIAREQRRPAEACAWFHRADAAWRAFDRRWGASASDKAADVAAVKAALSTCP